MKKLLLFPVVLLAAASCTTMHYSNATVQRTHHGMSASATDNYSVKLKFHEGTVDSVKTIADNKTLKYSVMPVANEPDSFIFVVSRFVAPGPGQQNPKAPEMQSSDYDLSKGFCIYYHAGKGKEKKLEIKEFKKLDDIFAP